MSWLYFRETLHALKMFALLILIFSLDLIISKYFYKNIFVIINFRTPETAVPNLETKEVVLNVIKYYKVCKLLNGCFILFCNKPTWNLNIYDTGFQLLKIIPVIFKRLCRAIHVN